MIELPTSVTRKRAMVGSGSAALLRMALLMRPSGLGEFLRVF